MAAVLGCSVGGRAGDGRPPACSALPGHGSPWALPKTPPTLESDLTRLTPSLVLALCLSALATNVAAETLSSPLQLPAVPAGLVEGRPAWPGATWLEEDGRPALPAQRLEFVVPPGQRVVGVRLVGASPVRLSPGAALPVHRSEAPPDGPAPRQDSFARPGADIFPPVEARLVAEGVRHGVQLVAVEAYPLRVAADGSLLWRPDVEVELELAPRLVPVDRALRLRAEEGWSESTRRDLAARVANPGALVGYDRPEPTPLRPAGELPPPAATPSLDTSPVQMLVLTNEALRSEFERLAEHKRAMGLATTVVTVEQVQANYRQGLDLAETLRLYIRDAYGKWATDYVLLGGDTGVIPARYARSTFYPPGSSTDIPADLYYSCLDGNWNADGDALFGEHFATSSDPGDAVDFEPEVAVGRAPVSTLAQAGLFVDKVIAYERPAQTGWQDRALFASEVLFPSSWSPGQGIQLDGATYSEDIVDSSLAYAPWPPFGAARLYENHTAYAGAFPETKQAVLDSMGSGQYGLVNHIGHGFYFNMSVGDNNIVVNDTDGLSNGPNYFVLYALNCSSAAFDFNCLMERFVLAPAGGSVASIGSARAAFPNKADEYQQAFYQALFREGTTRLGDAIIRSREAGTGSTLVNTSDRWTHLVYTLLGDPSLRVWTSEPRVVSASTTSTIQLGSNSLDFHVVDSLGGGPVEGASVAVGRPGGPWASGVTDANGDVVVDFDVYSLGEVELWVSGSNSLPQPQSYFVDLPAGAWVSAASFGLVDDGSAGSNGNGNGRPEAGETVVLSPSWSNGGVGAYAGGSAVLRCDDPLVTVVDSTATVPALSVGQVVAGGAELALALDPALPDGHEITLRFLVDDNGGGEFASELVVLMEAGELEVARLWWDDTVTGNGNLAIDTGEDVQVFLELKNFGAGAIDGVSATLSSSDPAVTIVDGAATWPALPGPLQLADNVADPLVVQQSDVTGPHLYQLTLTDAAGRVQVHEFDLFEPAQVTGLAQLPAGSGQIVLEWDRSTDGDLWGYRVYRRLDGTPTFDVASADVVVGSATFRDEGLAPLTAYEYAVAAVDSGGLEGQWSWVLDAATTPDEVLCFPLPMGQETSSDLAVGHIDVDGVMDMVVGSDLVYAIDGKCEEKVDGDDDSQTFGPITGTAGKYGPASIALGDLDGQPGQEIVASSWDTSELYVFDAVGNVLPGWPRSLNAKNWGTPALGDLDDDGDLEIVLIDTAGWTYAFHHDGSEVADGDANPGTIGPIAPRRVGENFGRTSPALYDVTGDGKLEILFGSKYQNTSINDVFYAIVADGSGASAPGWGKVFPPRSEFLASPTIADLDGDGIDEIIAHCENDSLYVWQPDGSRKAPFPLRMTSDSIQRDSLAPSVAVGNFDGDADLEMVVVETVSATNTRVRVLDVSGTTLSGWPVTVGNLSEASPVVGDIDGDGLMEIVWGTGGGSDSAPNYVYAWNHDGSAVTGFPIVMSGFVRSSPTLADFNGDGNVNILLASWDKLIHVWDMGAPYDPSLMPWPTFRGNVHRDGVYATRATQVGNPPLPKQGARLLPNVPNPFNPATVLRFQLPEGPDRAVRLVLYDATGRALRTLLDGERGPGTHQLRWDGTDGLGRQVASGVYFSRLWTDGQVVDTGKLTLLK